MTPDPNDNLAEWRKQKGKEDLQAFGVKTKMEKERLRFHISWKALLLTPLLLFALLLVTSIVQEILYIPENREIDKRIEVFRQVKVGMSEAEVISILKAEPINRGNERSIEFMESRPRNILQNLFDFIIYMNCYSVVFENGIATKVYGSGGGFSAIVF